MDIQKEREACGLEFEKEWDSFCEAYGNGYDKSVAKYFFFEAWQAVKNQEVPEDKYILQTFSTYSGVCEQRFKYKDVGIFESIDAAMFHARNIGLVMNHYGYEFRIVKAQEPK